MKITRRAALGATLVPLAAPALAQDWPTRPVRCVIPYPPHSRVFISDNPSSPFFTAFSRNLLQQNPVLLI